MRLFLIASNGRRVGDWIELHCGDHVCDVGDVRHTGRIEAILSGNLAKVKWADTGWISFVPTEFLRRVK